MTFRIWLIKVQAVLHLVCMIAVLVELYLDRIDYAAFWFALAIWCRLEVESDIRKLKGDL